MDNSFSLWCGNCGAKVRENEGLFYCNNCSTRYTYENICDECGHLYPTKLLTAVRELEGQRLVLCDHCIDLYFIVLNEYCDMCDTVLVCRKSDWIGEEMPYLKKIASRKYFSL